MPSLPIIFHVRKEKEGHFFKKKSLDTFWVPSEKFIKNFAGEAYASASTFANRSFLLVIPTT